MVSRPNFRPIIYLIQLLQLGKIRYQMAVCTLLDFDLMPSIFPQAGILEQCKATLCVRKSCHFISQLTEI